ncbi:hypothetical protein MGG_16502 [Pyricularia oryzae 70-15]|uniref:Uncharacterized protein n=2 Tax=Pyricularia oryzae TaxID=318829 RepID=G4MQW6_PYRO7|nr:uncharacterized protein MGG_16502 [Pyricularia oryzae 70-15]EHA58197.1 hypothetical protein MGG_16502 [Pyricularia oryzae 70-15]KAI7915701.1 hypothetical protein M9X92_008263 [Pyricularia oryzae]KAI7929263.1 hypothetical protein M0657_002238 [Pyricularia oryzae]QBZ63680.1 hypothetical protein PoMZ_05366 [Pyricularia oryzae]
MLADGRGAEPEGQTCKVLYGGDWAGVPFHQKTSATPEVEPLLRPVYLKEI